MGWRIVATLTVAIGISGCCGDTARRDDMLRRRQYELDQREARLKEAQRKFRECMAQSYSGEDPGLDAPQPPVGAGTETETPVEYSSAASLTPEQLDEIQSIERRMRPGVVACYTKELERRGNKKLQGKVAVNIHIGTNEMALKVVISESTLKEPRVHDCIVKTIRGWEFPALEAPAWYSTAFEFSPAY